MKLSLTFFYTKLKKHFPETELFSVDESVPMFSSVGILSPGRPASSELLYVDLLQNVPDDKSKHTTIITIRSRMSLFQGCRLLVLPDETMLTHVLEFVTDIFIQYNNWSNQIYEAIARHGELQELIEITRQIIDNPMYVADGSWKMLASWQRWFVERTALDLSQ